MIPRSRAPSYLKHHAAEPDDSGATSLAYFCRGLDTRHLSREPPHHRLPLDLWLETIIAMLFSTMDILESRAEPAYPQPLKTYCHFYSVSILMESSALGSINSCGSFSRMQHCHKSCPFLERLDLISWVADLKKHPWLKQHLRLKSSGDFFSLQPDPQWLCWMEWTFLLMSFWTIYFLQGIHSLFHHS